MHALRPALQEYDWGTTDDIPRLLGLEPTGRPVAEAWWGAHPSGPTLAAVGGSELPLGELIDADPEAALGPDLARAFDGRLPFLLKILAVARPLSIQVHPTPDLAREGFLREEEAGIAHDAPGRTYRDANHKPEMIVALTPMTVLSGFRPAASTRRDIERLRHPDAALLADVLRQADQGAAIGEYVRLALGEVDSAGLAAEIAESVPTGRTSAAAAAAAAAHFPGDPGVVVALAMNRVELASGDACFTPDRVVHSYQSGVGLEIMANSDNVIRGGLTSKHIDAEQLLAVVDTTPSRPLPPETEREDGVTMFWPRADEFLLSVIRGGTGEFIAHPRVVLSLDGETVVASEAGGERRLAPGEAVFVPYSDGDFALAANGTAAVAGVPLPDSDRRLDRAAAPGRGG